MSSECKDCEIDNFDMICKSCQGLNTARISCYGTDHGGGATITCKKCGHEEYY